MSPEAAFWLMMSVVAITACSMPVIVFLNLVLQEQKLDNNNTILSSCPAPGSIVIRNESCIPEFDARTQFCMPLPEDNHIPDLRKPFCVYINQEGNHPIPNLEEGSKNKEKMNQMMPFLITKAGLKPNSTVFLHEIKKGFKILRMCDETKYFCVTH